MKSLTIYTDGSSLGNPGPGGYAAIILDGEKTHIVSGGEPKTTNNRMEMKAVIEALRWVKTHKRTDTTIDLYSDSSLVMESLKQGWKRKQNLDLWAELDQLREGLPIHFHWVKGHADNPYNRRCDALAVSAAEKAAWPATTSPKRKKEEEGIFLCQRCHAKTEGLFGWLPDAEMVRVDCGSCRSFIKFAAPTHEHVARAKKRYLVSTETLERVVAKKEAAGETIGHKTLQRLKAWTDEEARQFLESQQKLELD